MIYRKRSRKTGYSIRFLKQSLKIEFGTRVWYFDAIPLFRFVLGDVKGLWKSFHTFQGLRDISGNETISHTRKRNRVTVYRAFA